MSADRDRDRAGLRGDAAGDAHAGRLSRRAMLQHCATGFGALAFAGLYGSAGALRAGTRRPAKHVIFLYMDGGVSQVDSFDHKPRLAAEHGQPIGMDVPPTQFDDVGKVLRSPWEFARYGDSGLEVSELFRETASRHADDLAVIRSMTSRFPEHTSANYLLHTGFGQQGRPSMGSWVSYGLGTENQDLPGFLVLDGGLIPRGGLDNFNSGFLPASFQGSLFRPQGEPVANLNPQESEAGRQQRKLDLVRALDRGVLDVCAGADAIESAIANHETAFRMQTAVPELMDLRGESEATRRLYGMDAEFVHTRTFGTQCLLARRLVERGVRFIELTCPDTGHDRWDQHGNLQHGHADNARAVDLPIAGLLSDLRARGLWQDTLVVFGTEFGRTPMAQGSNGRDHNPHGFSVWLAGGGVRGGTVYGATDDYGYYAVENPVDIHDLHATLLALLGVDHKRLTYRFDGRDMRLTDVAGRVIDAVIA